MLDDSASPRRPHRLSRGLIALGSSAVLAIFAAGYTRTGPAADQIARQQAAGQPTRSGPTPTAIALVARAIQPSSPPLPPPALPSGAAQATIPPATATPVGVPALPEVFQDGTYTGVGTSRHGGIQVTIEVIRGHIASAAITACQTRYPCSVIERLPAQVIARQGPNVDTVSGATDSSEAYRAAVTDALRHAR